jgi:hypothetical protein
VVFYSVYYPEMGTHYFYFNQSSTTIYKMWRGQRAGVMTAETANVLHFLSDLQARAEYRRNLAFHTPPVSKYKASKL